jgi:ferritin-like metal-binding protein YciE
MRRTNGKRDKTVFVKWLQGAYVMEEGVAQVLESHKEQARDYPEIRAKLDDHIRATKEHVKKVGGILKSLNEDAPRAKNSLGKAIGVMAGAGASTEEDTVIKNTMAEYATEHLEIATYRTLINTANKLKLSEAVLPLEEILIDEIKMAEWLHDNLPRTVKNYLSS